MIRNIDVQEKNENKNKLMKMAWSWKFLISLLEHGRVCKVEKQNVHWRNIGETKFEKTMQIIESIWDEKYVKAGIWMHNKCMLRGIYNKQWDK